MKTLVFIFVLILTPLAQSQDLYYEIHFNELGGYLAKKINKDPHELSCNIYNYKGKIKIKVIPSDVNELIEKFMLKTCAQKNQFVSIKKIEDYLTNFEFDKTKNSWKIYKDKTGVSELNEVWLKDSNEELSLIEKRSIGTSRYTYYKKGDLFYKVSASVYEGAQSIESEHQIEYITIGKAKYPKSINSQYIQKLTKRDIGEFKREFSEKVNFKNYKVEQNIALKYFTQEE